MRGPSDAAAASPAISAAAAAPARAPMPPSAPAQLLPNNPTLSLAGASLKLGVCSIVLCLPAIADFIASAYDMNLPGIVDAIAIALALLAPCAAITATIWAGKSRGTILAGMAPAKEERLASAGQRLGWIGLAVLGITIALPAVLPRLTKRIPRNEALAVRTIREINAAQITYDSAYPERGYAPDLATLGALCESAGSGDPICVDSRLIASHCTASQWCTMKGYKFILHGEPSSTHMQYTVSAIPVEANASGNRDFCSDESGVLRWGPADVGRTQPYTTEECGKLMAL